MIKQYLKRNSIPIFVPLLAIVLRVVSSSTAELSFVLLAVYALFGRVQAIQSLTLSWFFMMMNPGLFPNVGNISSLRYLVLISVSILVLRLGLAHISRVLRPLMYGTLLLITVLVLHSLFFSVMADVSILKVISWGMALLSSLILWAGMTREVRTFLIEQLFALLILVLIFSLPLVGSRVGSLVNGTGFQGILGHPQAYGAAMSLLGAWLGAWLISRRTPPWSACVLFGLCFYTILLSEARTGMLSLVFGLIGATVIVSFFSATSVRRLAPALVSGRLWLIIACMVFSAIITRTNPTDGIEQFIAKRGEATTVLEAYQMSRGGLMEKMLINIDKRPFTGIGFGIASSPNEMEVERDPVFGIPVSALVEKGIMPLAVLEEMGIFVAIGVFLWFTMLIKRSSLGGVAPLAVCLSALLINMGDSLFFSSGGMGLIEIVIVAWAATHIRIEDNHA